MLCNINFSHNLHILLKIPEFESECAEYATTHHTAEVTHLLTFYAQVTPSACQRGQRPMAGWLATAWQRPGNWLSTACTHLHKHPNPSHVWSP
jgi:hypothetical protein